MTARRDERGSVTPLIVGLALVLALLVGVVVDVSAAFLRRQGLNSLADAAALAATEGLEGDQVYTRGLGEEAVITQGAAEAFVRGYLQDSDALGRYPGLDWQVRVRGATVVVDLASPLRLPLRVPGAMDATTVRGSAASVVVVSD